MPARRLTVGEIEERLQQLPGWRRVCDELDRTYRFADSCSAMAFMTAIAEVARARDHHPDWQHSSSRIAVRLSTHDAGGITELDVLLARAMVEAAAEFGGE